MVHVLQNQNTYSSDPIGDALEELGSKQFIHGADSRVYGILGNDPSDDKIRELISAIGTGNIQDQCCCLFSCTLF